MACVVMLKPTNGKDHGGRGVDVAFKPDCAEPSRASYCSRAFESQRDPPPTTTRKISQPGYGSKHFQTTENPEAIIRRNIIDSMGSFAAWVFVSMTISTRDVIRRKHLSSQRRRPNEVMFSRQTQLKRTTPRRKKTFATSMFIPTRPRHRSER
jgi:hypothetical protein